jgi:hypothetical protein
MTKTALLFATLAFASQAACTAQTGDPESAAVDKTAEQTGTQSAAESITVENVVNAYSGLCLNVLNLSEANGARVVQAQDCAEPSSKWQFVPLGGGYYNIKALHSGQCLNVLNFAYQNGAQVVQALDCNEYSSQWSLEDRGGGRLNIRARHDGLCLNVLNWGTSNGASVVQALDCNISTSMWYRRQ